MKEILEAGGAGFLLPAVLFVMVLYAIRGVFGLHTWRGQNRREFLELWDKARSSDDLWLEVCVRHLFGTHLPSRVIRLALDQPDRSRSLADLSVLWDLLAFDPEHQTVHWRNTLPAKVARSRCGRGLCFVASYVCVLVDVIAAVIAAHYGHTHFAGWVYSVCALAVGAVALLCSSHDDAVKTAARAGNRWVDLINRSVANPSVTK
jgi:hypothetical protein